MTSKYQDLEYLLYTGFIPYKIQAGNVSFVFKSINEFEYENILLRSGLRQNKNFTLNFYINYLFYSIYMINGNNFLAKREEVYVDFIDYFRKYPFVLIKKLTDIAETLTARQHKCSALVEPYSFENNSRYRWHCLRHNSLNSKVSTGIVGTDSLNLNSFQKYWMFLNVREDRNDSYEEKYSLAKFLASFQDPKSVKRIDAQDKARREEEEKRREDIIEKGYEDKKIIHHNPADSKDGIIEELEKQMRGEKDDHDRFIEEYEKGLRTEMLKRMKDMKDIREKRSKDLYDHMEESRPISSEEMEDRIRKIRERKQVSTIHYGENETRSKYLQFSNVSDQDVIKESDFLNEEEYQTMLEDPMYEGMGKYNKNNVEDKYQKEQRRLAQENDVEDKYRGNNIKAYPIRKDN